MLSFNYIQKGKKENHVPPLNAPTLCILKRDRASDILPLPYVHRMKKKKIHRITPSLFSHCAVTTTERLNVQHAC